jgi:hypothetical protein
VGALGTLAAVGVALYLSAWRDTRSRPELSLTLGDQSEIGGIAILGYDQEDWGDVMPIYVQVSNSRGRRTAHDVEVLLTAKWHSRAPGYAIDPTTQFDSRSLGWAFATSSAGTATQVAIPPGVTRRIEILRVGPSPWIWMSVATPEQRADAVERAKSAADEKRDPYLPAWQFSGTGVFNTPPITIESAEYLHAHLTYDLTFAVTARDVDAKIYRTTLRFNDETENGNFVLWLEWKPLQVERRTRRGKLKKPDDPPVVLPSGPADKEAPAHGRSGDQMLLTMNYGDSTARALYCEVTDPEGATYTASALPALERSETRVFMASYPEHFRGAPTLMQGSYQVSWQKRRRGHGPGEEIAVDSFDVRGP